MALEPGVNHITDLVAANPVAGDNVSQGDDHLRNIKTALLNDFANINAAVTADPTDLNRTDVTTEGTVEASKVVTADGSGNIDFNNGNMTNVDINSGTIDGVTVGTTNTLADGLTATTQSASDNSTKLATTAYVDVQTDTDIAAMKVTSTAQTTYAAGDDWTYAHGKGSVPDLILCYAILQATHTDNGYSAGDKIMLVNSITGASSGFGVQVWADDTNLGGVITAIPRSSNKTTGAVAALATGEWDIHIEGVWFS